MKTLPNIIWFLLIGFWSALIFGIVGLLFCLTIIGIPFGLQLFKFAELVMTPFGKEIDLNFGAHPIANLIWIIFGGLECCIVYIIGGVILCITVIGIPLGLQAFKMGTLVLAPFGARVNQK